MPIAVVLLVLTMLSGAAGWAQQPPDDADIASAPKAAAPLPDKDGDYRVVDGIVPPVMVSPEPPVFPAEVTTELSDPLICTLSAVIGVDGVASRVQVVHGCSAAFRQSATDSIAHSHYRPGTLGGKPVPVLVHLRVRFQDPLFANAPRIALRYREAPEDASPSQTTYDTPPKAIHIVTAEFPEKARRSGTGGTVMVSLVVDAEGKPTKVQVVSGVGEGLDEEAIKAVSQYRFTPAMKDGKPVPAPISVQVSFKLFKGPVN